MLALTLWQPWAWAVAWADKDVENRGRAPDPQAVGHRIAIHGGMQLDIDQLEAIAKRFHVRPANYRSQAEARPVGTCSACAIAATARLAGWVLLSSVTGRSEPKAWSGGLPWTRASSACLSDWNAGGPYLWLLDDVEPLETPIPCLGQRGFWPLPFEVEQALKQARAA